ncbi:MAG: atsA 3 [Verrucomicrobiaceae bacterium]|nr:atsA 3 [Verrucomicrobiaceae bacterium]
MTRFHLALPCLLAAALSPLLHAEAPHPNFIIINIDDMGYADIGPFGSKLNRTPNLDRMAAEGMKLKCHYAAPVCSPSRASLMTGCYPKRVLPIPGVLFPSSAVGLNPKEQTIAEVLKSTGYATMCIGKWHLGDQPEFLPTAQGFDHYFGLPYSNDMGLAAEGSKSSLGEPLPHPGAVKDGAQNETGLGGNRQPPLPLVRDHTVVERVNADGQQTITQRYAEEAVKFIHDNKAHRFFLYLPPSAVHFPLYPGKAFHNKSKNGLYGDWVEEVDWMVGQVFDTVRELKLDANTLILFTSDNGGTPRAVNAPLRGFKTTTWEGGMRVPTIAWWPGKIAAGTATDEITSMMDVLPTFAGLAGASLPERKIDGLDLWPLLSGKGEVKGPHEVFYFYRGLKLEAVRAGDWKLQLASGDPPKNPGPKKQKKQPPQEEPFPRLYNLKDDIGESKNVVADHADKVAELQALADKMKDDLGLNGVGPGCRELGRVQNPQPLISSEGVIRDGFKP